MCMCMCICMCIVFVLHSVYLCSASLSDVINICCYNYIYCYDYSCYDYSRYDYSRCYDYSCVYVASVPLSTTVHTR